MAAVTVVLLPESKDTHCLYTSLMTQTVLPQLKEIASELVEQETSLVAQLAEVREKLAGVRAVLPLFGANSTETETASAPTADPEALVENLLDEESLEETQDEDSEPEGSGEASIEIDEAANSEDEADAEDITEEKATQKKKTKASKKKDGRTASWQKYTRPEVKEKTIPEAVRLVLETQSDKSFKIAEVMDAIFKDGMPKQQYLKARNRISNILSGGVRDSEWFKGERGTYSLTDK